MKNKELKIGLVVVALVVILTVAYFSFREVDVPNGEEIIDIPEVLAAEYIVLEGGSILPDPEDIPLIDVCIKIPAETEDKAVEMAIVAVERWLKNQKDIDIKAISDQVESNLKRIKELNGLLIK